MTGFAMREDSVTFVEDKLRLGRDKSVNKFTFVSALDLHYLCKR